MMLAKFMAGFVGRAIRVILGLVMIAVGLFAVQGTAGIILAVVGILPVAAGVFNFCAIAPILGVPFMGKAVLESK